MNLRKKLTKLQCLIGNKKLKSLLIRIQMLLLLVYILLIITRVFARCRGCSTASRQPATPKRRLHPIVNRMAVREMKEPAILLSLLYRPCSHPQIIHIHIHNQCLNWVGYPVVPAVPVPSQHPRQLRILNQDIFNRPGH